MNTKSILPPLIWATSMCLATNAHATAMINYEVDVNESGVYTVSLLSNEALVFPTSILAAAQVSLVMQNSVLAVPFSGGSDELGMWLWQAPSAVQRPHIMERRNRHVQSTTYQYNTLVDHPYDEPFFPGESRALFQFTLEGSCRAAQYIHLLYTIEPYSSEVPNINGQESSNMYYSFLGENLYAGRTGANALPYLIYDGSSISSNRLNRLKNRANTRVQNNIDIFNN